MPLRQTAEHMAGRKFENEQEATMFLQSRLSGRGARGIEELNRAQMELYGGSARVMGRTDLGKVSQRLSESAQGVLLGTSEKGLNVALGGLNLLADMMGVLGKLNTSMLGVPGLMLLVGGFGYLKNGFTQAKASLDAFVASLSSFSSTVQTAQVRNAAASAMNVAGSIPMYLSSYAQMSGQMNPAFLAANQFVNGQWVPIPPPAPLTPMQKVKAGISTRLTAANAALNNFFTNMNPNMAGNLLTGGLMLAGTFASQSLANQQAQNIGNQKVMAESTRMQNALGGAASGAMLGNMIGTLFPGVGNIVGTIAGSLLGGAAGYFTSPDPNKVETQALDENTKALNNATVAMTLLASSIIGAGPRAAGAVSAIELEMYMATRNNMMNAGLA
jgi:outer membrane lipoprotein SlyB